MTRRHHLLPRPPDPSWSVIGDAEMTFERGAVTGCHFRFVRSNENNESFLCRLADEPETLADLTSRSAKLSASLVAEGDRVRVTPK